MSPLVLAASAGGVVGPDAVPASPSVYDEEFKTTPSGWTDFGTLDSFNVTDFPGAGVRIQKTATVAFNLHGKLKAIPSMPFFMWWKVPDIRADAAYQQIGVCLSAAGTNGPFFDWGGLVNNNNYGYAIYGSRTSRSTWGGDIVLGRRFPYCGILVTSTTNLATYVSEAGFAWRPITTGINPGFTITQFGPFCCGQDGSVLIDGVLQFIRFRAAV